MIHDFCTTCHSKLLENSIVVKRGNEHHHAMGRSPKKCTLSAGIQAMVDLSTMILFARAPACSDHIERRARVVPVHFFINILDTALSVTIMSTRHWRTIGSRKMSIETRRHPGIRPSAKSYSLHAKAVSNRV